MTDEYEIEKLKRQLHIAGLDAKDAVDWLTEIQRRKRFGIVTRYWQTAFAAAEAAVEAKQQIEAKLDRAVEAARKSGRITDRAADVAKAITDWATAQATVRGLALVGSHARCEARRHSDIDFMVLAVDPKTFKTDSAWPTSIAWPGRRLVEWEDEIYDLVWSRRLRLDPFCEVEMSFGPLSWAVPSPVDPGTRKIVSGGFRALYDPDGMMERLCAECQQ